MIGFVDGTVKAVHKNYLIVLAERVGYRIFVTPQVLLATEDGKPISLYTHTYVREDQLSLYGFPTLKELDLFELLITVSGIGPKSALGILSIADVEMIKSGIVSEDASVFTKVSGIGRKTAERLIIELRGRIDDTGGIGGMPGGKPYEHADVLDVLVALGYSQKEAREAVSVIPKSVTETNDKVREALRALAKQ